ncbi:MAG TPA: CGNR zinc finger domain-containing protein [Micromonosporaceae bacterium]|nr:CGNR zinc finger domain-containing protein [Micromonosporaceae bacterium]
MAPSPLPLPEALVPVLAFVNTVDVETGTDALGAGAPALARWLVAQHLSPRAAAGPADHALALDLRAGLRACALVNNGGRADPEALARGARAAAHLPLVGVVDPVAAMPLAPAATTPVRAALSTIVAGYALAVASGDWRRVRRCPADDCAWVFWDSSARAGRRWCTMRVCGNRAKARAFAQRRAQGRAGGAATPPAR